jgi:hypothetical protein
MTLSATEEAPLPDLTADAWATYHGAVLLDSLVNGGGLGNARSDDSCDGVNARPLPDGKGAENEDEWNENTEVCGELGHDWVWVL